MTDEPAEIDWSTRLTLGVAAEVKRHRARLGISAQQLADRCTEVGMPIQRSVLSNLESGRRTTITVAELLVLARALEVPAGCLLFPVGYEPKSEHLPGRWYDPIEAVDLISGYIRPWDIDKDRYLSNAIFLIRHHQQIAGSLRTDIEELSKSRRSYMLHAESLPGKREQLDSLKKQIRILDERAERIMQLNAQKDSDPLADVDRSYLRLAEISQARSVLREEINQIDKEIIEAGSIEYTIQFRTKSAAVELTRLTDVRKKIEAEGLVLPELPKNVESYMRGYIIHEDSAPREV